METGLKTSIDLIEVRGNQTYKRTKLLVDLKDSDFKRNTIVFKYKGKTCLKRDDFILRDDLTGFVDAYGADLVMGTVNSRGEEIPLKSNVEEGFYPKINFSKHFDSQDCKSYEFLEKYGFEEQDNY